MDSKKEKLSNITLIVGIIEAVLPVIGSIGQYMESPWFQGVFFAFSISLVICLILMIRNLRNWKLEAQKVKEKDDKSIKELKEQNDELNNDVKLLRENICSGLEYLSNDVTISFIKGNSTGDHKYKLTFHKKCRVIGESKWYSGQVYFNNQLQNEEASEKFYQDNPIAWEGLKARASIKTYTSDGTVNDHDAEIYAVAKSPRYFQFHIRYGTSDGRINPAEYDSFEIIYSYEVPISHWGSYINRTVSYFGEPTKVILQMDLKDYTTVKKKKTFIRDFENEILVYEKKLDLEPNLLNNDAFHITTDTSGNITIELPKTRSQKYVVSWDPKLYFGSSSFKTEITKDTAELTAR